MQHNKEFSEKLLAWHKTIDRPMPWKGEKDPYLIWLSEIILQQTRVEQGWSYYERFKKQYPTVEKLAKAPQDEVLKMWEGLGYYSRARNMHYAAQQVMDEHDGIFPKSYEELLGLKGVGKYTAAAIASFAYNKAYAVLDGNVKRVLSRVFVIEEAIDSKVGLNKLEKISQELLIKKRAGEYNQAIMDFGATICSPRQPGCSACPMSEICGALKRNKVKHLPQKSKKVKKRLRHLVFVVFIHKKTGKVWIQKRGGGDIWQGLYGFPCIESPDNDKTEESIKPLIEAYFGWKAAVFQKEIKTRQQTLTHQLINASFIEQSTQREKPTETGKWVKKRELIKFAFPKVILKHINDDLVS